MYTVPNHSQEAPKKQKTAAERLADKMGELVDRAAAQMSDKEFKRAHEKSKAIIARVRARASAHETK